MGKAGDARNNSSTRSSRISRLRSTTSKPMPSRGKDIEKGPNFLAKVSKYKKILLAVVAAGALAAAAGVGDLVSSIGKVKITSVAPSIVSAQQPYQDCNDYITTSYVKYHKNGTEGAVIGGATGAAVIGIASHSWVGAGVGLAVGAIGGDLIQRGMQPKYVRHKSTKTACQILTHQINVPIGYQVWFIGSDSMPTQIITQHQPPLGGGSLKDLQADQVSPQQQQQMVQAAINANNKTSQSSQNSQSSN